MQLQMTAPLDIGLEQIDASLGMGQEDMFDLTGTERQLRNKGGIGIIRVDDDTPEDEDEDEVVARDDEEDEVLDSEEERDRKASRLEAEMDGLYDAYQEKLKERDSKFQAREARHRSGMLEEWGGIQDDNISESDEEGGWDQMEAAKGDNDDSSDESDDEEQTSGRKRRRPQAKEMGPNKKGRLVTKLEEPTAGGRASQVWFSQDLFGGVEGLDDIEGEEEGDDDVDMASAQHDVGEEEWQDDVRPKSLILSSMLMRSSSILLHLMVTLKLWPSGTTTTLKCGTLRTRTKMRLRRNISKVRVMGPPGIFDES
jgi:AdoMet-dependent rRNA methyltransferase SPB1